MKTYKQGQVSALRERGWRRECGGEPQVSEHVTSIARKADTIP